MRSFKLFWNIHKWTGITIAVVVTITASTGFLLLMKKRVAWIQPPTQVGASGTEQDLITMQTMFRGVFMSGHPDFKSIDDIDRVDFRPEQRVFKVHSKHNYSEIQVCAITGDVLSIAWRPSDLFEDIHDGSFWAKWWHDWIMPAIALALLLMVGSGVWLWIEPSRRRWRRRRAQA